MEGCIQRLQGEEKDGKGDAGADTTIHRDPPSVEGAEEQQESTGQAMVDPLPPNEGFNPQVYSTPEREERQTASEKRCKRLQAEKCKLRKQIMHLKKQLAETRKKEKGPEKVR